MTTVAPVEFFGSFNFRGDTMKKLPIPASIRRRVKAGKPATASFDGRNWPAMSAELWPLHKIVPYDKNPRTHPPAQIAMLADLMKKHGVDQPIAVDENGVILKGHGRRAAAAVALFDEFPVVRHLGLSDADKIAMRIQDNQVALLSGWDQELIRGEIGTLKSDGFETSLLGFGEAQLVQFTTTPGPPAEFKKFDEDIDTAYCCPKCRYSWSGNPLAGNMVAADDDTVSVRVREKTTSKGRSRTAKKVSSAPSLARKTKTRKGASKQQE